MNDYGSEKVHDLPQLAVAGHLYEVEAILFDKDGTLIDFIHTWGRWSELLYVHFSEELKKRNLPPLQDCFLQKWGIAYDENGAISDYDRNGPLSMGTVDELLSLLTWEGYRKGLSWAEAKVLAHSSRVHADRYLEASRTAKLMPDVLQFLEQCRSSGIVMGVVTADETEAAEKHLEWLGIRDYFAVCIGADQVTQGKPYPEMVETACRKLSVSCSRTAVIGDTNGDMLMARSAGSAVAVGISIPSKFGGTGLAEADFVISSYRELSVQKMGGMENHDSWHF
ncbi:HAD family hydrolase [Paenibacillus puldeungensis]|uniref:HAD family hydrolase n=1 Tax=Paenibacillus puldeungensis TaxID=696536 RepID=A0ABW3RUY9_9BACL